MVGFDQLLPNGFELLGLRFAELFTPPGIRGCLLDTLQIRIVETIEAFSLLKEDPQYELHVLSTKRAGYLQELAKEHAAAIDLEIAQLKTQADALETEINELTGTPGTVV